MEKYLSMKEVAELFNKDPGYISKVVRDNKIKPLMIKRKSDGRIFSGFTTKEIDQLRGLLANSMQKVINNKEEMTLQEIAKTLKMNLSNLRKSLNTYKINIFYRKLKNNNRNHACILRKDFSKYLRETERPIDIIEV